MTEIEKHAGNLFERIVAILEEARGNVVRAVNNNMVIAYWLIGREIVEEVQGGDERADYGKNIIDTLSKELNQKFGRGFSATNLRYFRTFYQVYIDRKPVIRHIGCGELEHGDKSHIQCGVLNDLSEAVETSAQERGFSPNLGWSHYRALMDVENSSERLFYEIEAEKEHWEVKQLERHVHSFLFARLLKSRDKNGVMALTREGQALQKPADVMKNPYILDFLGIPDVSVFHESQLEAAIISNLQDFLLELGKGFAFVGRQKRMQFDDKYFYIDLVFYNCILKCYLLIDLKMGELTHQDIGQIDAYVRMFEERYKQEGDNPTIGLVLCSKKKEAIVKYSVLNESKQLFAAKYMLYLPSEEDLRRELERERTLIEEMKSLED